MLLALVALGCMIGAYYVNRFHHQRQVVEFVQRHGGQLAFHSADESQPPPRRRLAPARMTDLLLNDIEQVTLFFASVPDHELSVLRNCRRLKRLDLDYTSIGDRGLIDVAQLSSLQWLDVKETQVTDAGMASIAQLRQLESLILDGLPVTNEGLKHLENVPSLRYLSVRETDVNEDGLRRFQRANPLCQVVR
jgi:hypothetical protein